MQYFKHFFEKNFKIAMFKQAQHSSENGILSPQVIHLMVLIPVSASLSLSVTTGSLCDNDEYLCPVWDALDRSAIPAEPSSEAISV